MMGNWGQTCYVRCADKQKVSAALAAVFQREGKSRTGRPAERKIDYRNYNEPMQYGKSYDSDLWGLVLIDGTNGWTAIQTAPLELLVEEGAEEGQMRLAELALELKTECIYFGMYDSSEAIIVEATKDGSFAISGFRDIGDDDEMPGTFNGFPQEEEEMTAHFQLIPKSELQPSAPTPAWSLVQKLFDMEQLEREHISQESFAEALGRLLCGPGFAHWENGLQMLYLIPHREINGPQYLEAYFRGSSYFAGSEN